jgi:[protein-PII] uridylyltransferase
VESGQFPTHFKLHIPHSAFPGAFPIEVEARGRPGLLYRISNVLSAQGRNIEALLVDTQGHKAVDVFYITRGGGALDADWEAALDKELRRVLGG